MKRDGVVRKCGIANGREIIVRKIDFDMCLSQSLGFSEELLLRRQSPIDIAIGL
jgi:hypothetical protein